MARTLVCGTEPISRAELRRKLGASPVLGVLEQLAAAPPARGACPHCGTTEARVDESGLVGCPLCYAVHAAYLAANFPVAGPA